MALRPFDNVSLVVVDAQFDYVDVIVDDDRNKFILSAHKVLTAFRDAGQPVIHVRTSVRADGSNAMPHRRDAPLCIDGTRGADVPEDLRALENEQVVTKSHFSAFDNPGFEARLRHREISKVVIIGAYTHACVRETAIDAYRLGFDVIVVPDAVVSPDRAHAEATLAWLDGRVAEVVDAATVVKLVKGSSSPSSTLSEDIRRAQVESNQSDLSLAQRSEILHRWADRVESLRERFATDIASAINKPLPLADDEVGRAISHIRTAANLPRNGFVAEIDIAPGVRVRNEPVGVVALIMPWNNPLAIPAGKIAAAYLGGNGIVVKPSPLDGGIAATLVREAEHAGLVGLTVTQDTDAAGLALAWRDDVDAIAITGSIDAGSAVARACAATGKPLQAELGGNNAAIVTADSDLDVAIPELVRNAFVFGGQRCTAIRRWIVERSIQQDFIERVIAETQSFSSDPLVGTLINPAAVDRVSRAIERAIADGGQVLIGGVANPEERSVIPTVIQSSAHTDSIVQDELFGPVAVIETSTSLKHAVSLANGVKYGLLVGVCSDVPETIEYVARNSRVGIVQIGARPVPVHPEAPFGGWGHSGIGPAEHGKWDMQFYTRPRTIYDLSV